MNVSAEELQEGTSRQDLTRKALHLLMAVLPVSYSQGAPRDLILGFLGTGTVVALLMEGARKRSPAFRRVFSRWFGAILKPQEHTSTTGAAWLWPSCLMAVLLLSREAAVSTLWCATVGDPLAALVGNAWRAWRGTALGTGKTAAGSAACFAASFAGIVMLTRFPLFSAAVIALAATVFERLPLPIDDNFRVSAAAGVSAWLLS